jgi:hypothetical protein
MNMRSAYRVENLPVVLQQALEEHTVYEPSGETKVLHANVSLSQALRLYSVVRQLRPLVSVEAGLGNGISTLAILQAIADNGQGIHHVIDPFQKAGFNNIGREMVRRAGLESHYVFHETFVENVVPNLPQVQFGFIDASHIFDLTLVEFVLVDKKLAIGGMIGFHDLWMPSQKKVLHYILNNREYEVVPNPLSARMKVGKTPRQKLVRRISQAVSRLPLSEKIFSAELRNYHIHNNFENLTILRKTADDTRDWQFHKPF